MKLFLFFLILAFLSWQCTSSQPEILALQPEIDGDWWQVAGNPDLGDFTSDGQEPVDFGIWPAKDGSWQLWSCIRKTKAPGNTRLFHRWEGENLTDSHWLAKGIVMTSDTTLGEALNGLQAPYVIQLKDSFLMFYGDWNRICLATSSDGKSFDRYLRNGSPALFGNQKMTRDPMVIRQNDQWMCYYVANPEDTGKIYMRTSANLFQWSEPSTVSWGGEAGYEFWKSECPFVIPDLQGYHYLFRTQSYGKGKADTLQNNQLTRIYRSRDLTDFGKDDDQYLAARLKVAAPEIFKHRDQWYIAALMPDLQGIRIAKLKWVEE
ncbi:MAG: hypothetical protein ACNS62_02070 [Candidatus Cyclobacteriaceae bacterium M3_2C_046]